MGSPTIAVNVLLRHKALKKITIKAMICKVRNIANKFSKVDFFFSLISDSSALPGDLYTSTPKFYSKLLSPALNPFLFRLWKCVFRKVLSLSPVQQNADSPFISSLAKLQYALQRKLRCATKHFFL